MGSCMSQLDSVWRVATCIQKIVENSVVAVALPLAGWVRPIPMSQGRWWNGGIAHIVWASQCRTLCEANTFSKRTRPACWSMISAYCRGSLHFGRLGQDADCISWDRADVVSCLTDGQQGLDVGSSWGTIDRLDSDNVNGMKFTRCIIMLSLAFSTWGAPNVKNPNTDMVLGTMNRPNLHFEVEKYAGAPEQVLFACGP